MAILIDSPAWPAHGTLWSHLVSDVDNTELHVFAARLGVPRRGFDIDHYDVPKSLYERALALGATPVSTRVILQRLQDAGLRVRQVDKASVRQQQRGQYLREEWQALGRNVIVPTQLVHWHTYGEQLLARWNEPHRHYHNEEHLEFVLLSLNQLAIRGERIAAPTLLAAWFHDAVYLGKQGDEQDSARLAVAMLGELDVEPSVTRQVGDLIEATAPGVVHAQVSTSLAHMLDADLSIFATSKARYSQYASDVRREYLHVDEESFRVARANILQGYLDKTRIYNTAAAKHLWEQHARSNLHGELTMLETVIRSSDIA